MRITNEQICDFNNLGGHLILSCLVDPKMIEECRKNGYADVVLTINGQEVDFQDFIDHWQSEVSESIEKRAKELMEEKFDSIRDKFNSLEEILDDTIQQVIEIQ